MNEIEIAERLTKVEERAKSNTHQIDELKPVVNEIHTMSKTMVQLVGEVQHTNENVVELKEKVETLENEPAERWNSMRRTIFTTVVSTVAGALVGAILALIL